MNSVYIAMSLDGYIADENKSVSFLDKYNDILKDSKYYQNDFINYFNNFDVVVMGYSTYEDVLKFGIEIYQDKPIYVITRKTNLENTNQVTFLNLEEYLNLNINTHQTIIGGSQIIKKLMDRLLIDEFIITIIPVVLGQGIPLFSTHKFQEYQLVSSHEDCGVIQLKYHLIKRR